MFLILIQLAHAVTYDVEIAVPATPYPNMVSGTEFVMRRMLTPTTHTDVEQQSTHPNIVCRVDEGQVVAEFHATSSNWPTLPVTGSCSDSGYTMNVTAVPMSAATDLSLQSQVIGANNTVSFAKATHSILWRSYALPTGTYTAGEYISTLPGARCAVSYNADAAKWFVQVRHPEFAALGSGTCTIARPDQSAYVLNVSVGAASI